MTLERRRLMTLRVSQFSRRAVFKIINFCFKRGSGLFEISRINKQVWTGKFLFWGQKKNHKKQRNVFGLDFEIYAGTFWPAAFVAITLKSTHLSALWFSSFYDFIWASLVIRMTGKMFERILLFVLGAKKRYESLRNTKRLSETCVGWVYGSVWENELGVCIHKYENGWKLYKPFILKKEYSFFLLSIANIVVHLK